MKVGRISRKENGKTYYWEVLRFKKLRDLNRWVARHKIARCRYRVASTIEWLNCVNLLGTLLISDEKCDINTLAHEAVHMAKILVAKSHQQRNEEALACAVGDLTETLLEMLNE